MTQLPAMRKTRTRKTDFHMQTKEITDKEVGQKSPFAGCAILIAALAVMLFLIGFSVTALFRQFNEIAKFTDERPRVIDVVSLDEKEAELNRLAEKLESFRLAVDSDESANMELSAEEMNLAIAVYEPFKDLRGMLRVEEISPESIRFEISFQLNGKPRIAKDGEGGMMASDPRYLNAILVAEPGFLQREVILQIRDIRVPGRKVPWEFKEQMSPYRIAERYVGKDGIGTTMAKLTSVELGDGFVRFEKKAGVIAKDTVTDAEVNQAGARLFTVLGIVSSVFLLVAGVVIFFGLRLKRKSTNRV